MSIFSLLLGKSPKVDYNQAMNEQRADPAFLDRLSILSAVILLAYAITPYVNLPAIQANWRILGILLDFKVDFSTYISIFIPAFAAVGMYWLVESHPAHDKERFPIQHSILPAVTAWVIGLPLADLLQDQSRWIVFAFAGALMLIVFVAEYTVVDPHSDRHTIAAGVLKALSLALLLFLAIAVHAAGLRLYLALPALGIPVLLVLLRTFYLYSGGTWLVSWPLAVAIITGQLVIALHYLPLKPLSFGLVITAALYAMIDFSIAYRDTRNWRTALPGPALIFVILMALAFLL